MPGYGERYWSDRTADNRRRSYPKFRGKDTADVVVIGGGLTGCAAAYVLANGGLDVILLEAERLACGSTAGSLGTIVPEPDAEYRSVEPLAGRRAARTAWKETRRAATEFAEALGKLPTKSDVRRAPLLVNAASSRLVEELRREQAARRDAGLEAAWASASAAAAELGTESKGALRLPNAFTFDPVRAALGLAGAAPSTCARIFEQSPVLRTKFTRREAQVVLASGAIRTRGVVVATGGPGALFGQLRRHVRESAGYVVVTAPLGAAMRRETGRKSSVLTEVGPDRHWIRGLADDRLLCAGALSRPVGSRQRDRTVIQRTAQLMYELSVTYPAISGLPAEWGWDVPIVTTPDGLPWIGSHRNYPFHFFALAMGWQGDALGWLAARAALRYFRGEPRKEDEAFGFVRHL